MEGKCMYCGVPVFGRVCAACKTNPVRKTTSTLNNAEKRFKKVFEDAGLSEEEAIKVGKFVVKQIIDTCEVAYKSGVHDALKGTTKFEAAITWEVMKRKILNMGE